MKPGRKRKQNISILEYFAEEKGAIEKELQLFVRIMWFYLKGLLLGAWAGCKMSHGLMFMENVIGK